MIIANKWNLLLLKEKIDRYLDTLIPDTTGEGSIIFKAARYSLLAGGKRFRPLLTLATVDAFHGDIDDAIKAACAVEMVHTYSLIHDDLPSMDNDDLRRGKPTCHKQFSEAIAILAGDYLLTRAFEVIASRSTHGSANCDLLISSLCQGAGGSGMICGQAMDLEGEASSLTLNQIESIHHHKTGALINSAIQIGAMIANTNSEARQKLSEFAYYLGLAFQITDDILDVTSTENEIGKPIASDLAKQKSTYVSLLGLDEAKIKAKEAHEKAANCIKALNIKDSLLMKLVEGASKRAH